jgi:methyltransferase
MTIAVLLALAAFLPMIAEALLSARNERALRARGAWEPPDDVYRTMQAVYPASFLGMLAEGAYGGVKLDGLLGAGVAIFVAAKALKYWAITSLGDRWSFRVLVLPGAPLVTGGPYRLLRHPNYVGVAGELIGMALMAHAPVTGLTSVIGFGLLILLRVRVEERALGLRAGVRQP